MKDKNGEPVSGSPCDKFARGKTGLCAAHSALVTDRQVLGGSVIGSAIAPGLAPGLFRGLVAGAGQSRPSGLATTSTTAETAATGGSRPVGSVSAEMRSGASETPDASSSDAPSNSARAPIGIWVQRGSALSRSSMSQGFSGSMDTTNPSMVSDASGTVHGPYRGGILGTSQGGNQLGDGRNLNASGNPGVGGLADSTAELDLNPRAPETTMQPTPSSLPFHQPLIPPQVLVPLSMQKDIHLSNKSRNGRPPRPQLSDADEGVFNMGLLSLPEGRVHGGGLMPSLSGSRVHGGKLTPAVPEGRVHGGGVMDNVGDDSRHRVDAFNFRMDSSRTPTYNMRYPVHGHSIPGSCASDNGLLRPDLSLERNNSLGIDVGQFLATGVDLN